MDTAEFHTEVVAAFKKSMQGWDFDSNPLEWEGIPSDIYRLLIKVVKESMEESRKGVFGAPFLIDYGDFDHSIYPARHIPTSDTVLKIEISPFPDSDDWAGGSFNLADAILKDAEGGDEGWTVGHAIWQLERTIEKLKREGQERGWDIAYDPR